MVYVALVLASGVALLGVLGLVSPVRLLGLFRRIETPGALYAVAGFRLLMGASLLLAAPVSKAPNGVLAIGVVAILSGLFTFGFGVDRTRRWIDWWAAKPTSWIRAWGAAALAIGLLLVWVLLP